MSLQLEDLDAAVEIARTVPELEAETKRKAIGDRALAVWRFDLARESFEKAGDLSALMLLLLATGDRDGLTKLAAQAGTYTWQSLWSGPTDVTLSQRPRARTTSRSPPCCSWETRSRASTC